MKLTRGFWELGCIVLLSGTMTAQPPTNLEKVFVLVYRNVGVPEPALERARTEAVRVLHAAGIQLAWINCSYGTFLPGCHPVATKGLLFLKIVAARKSSNDKVFGEAFLDENGEGNLADLFFDRIQNAQREQGLNAGRLLGAVAAHEIGHLLLGSSAHSGIGIMTPVWDEEKLRRVSMGTLFFTHQQADRMHQRLHRAELTMAEADTRN
jgi:hypothetical protein